MMSDPFSHGCELLLLMSLVVECMPLPPSLSLFIH